MLFWGRGWGKEGVSRAKAFLSGLAAVNDKFVQVSKFIFRIMCDDRPNVVEVKLCLI